MSGRPPALRRAVEAGMRRPRAALVRHADGHYGRVLHVTGTRSRPAGAATRGECEGTVLKSCKVAGRLLAVEPRKLTNKGITAVDADAFQDVKRSVYNIWLSDNPITVLNPGTCSRGSTC